MRRNLRTLSTILALMSAIVIVTSGQVATSDWISEIDVLSLTPLRVSFRLTNGGAVTLADVNGRVTLSDQFGQTIEVLSIALFSVPVGDNRSITTASRWDFQKTGIYLLEIALDLGTGILISNSIAFRILPVQLPLAPAAAAFGQGLKTLYQQPVNWGIHRISAPAAWTITHGSSDIIVAVIDTGIDRSIPQLEASMWVNPGEIRLNGIDDDGNGYTDDIHGWDFRDRDNCSLTGTDLHWHGTFVAGIIAAQPGRLPIVGVAPGVRIMDIRFLDSNNRFSSRDWNMFADAIDYAVDNGAHIINMSIFANFRPPAVMREAIGRAVHAGVVIIGIAGNTGQIGVLYPGKYTEIYAVSAITAVDLLADFSAYGPEVSLCAPGHQVTSFLPGGQAATRSGTSFAAPHVSGTLALILSAFPALSPTQAMDILMGSLIDLGPRGFDSSFGHGLINVFEAVND